MKTVSGQQPWETPLLKHTFVHWLSFSTDVNTESVVCNILTATTHDN